MVIYTRTTHWLASWRFGDKLWLHSSLVPLLGSRYIINKTHGFAQENVDTNLLMINHWDVSNIFSQILRTQMGAGRHGAPQGRGSDSQAPRGASGAFWWSNFGGFHLGLDLKMLG